MTAFLVGGIIAALVTGAIVGAMVQARRSPRRNHQTTGQGVDHAMIEVTTLAGVLAHEIRNPLSTLHVNLTLLGEDWADDTLSERDLRRRSLNRLDTLRAEADRLNRVVEDFLRLIGRHELQLVEVDVNDLVRRLVAFYEPQARSLGIDVRTELAATPLHAAVDEDLLGHALLNLAQNAQDAMPNGGTLTFATRRSQDGQIVMQVRDTGSGFSAEVAKRLFEPFYSTKARGTGLGLALTRRIIHAHNGDIGATGGPGKGATFTIRLPQRA